MEESVKVGERIKEIREEQGISLEELSRMTGMSPSVLSQIENRMLSPSLGALIKISKALGIPLGRFLGEEKEEPFTIVRKDERRPATRFGTKDGVGYGYSYESLGHGMKGRHMEPFLVSLEVVPEHLLQPSVHEGEEFLFVLEGEVEVQLAGHSDTLYPGDSIYYHSSIPHLVRAKGGKEAKILAVIYIG